MRWVLCILLIGCGNPTASPTAPRRAPTPPPADAAAADAAAADAAAVTDPVDALVCQYHQCMDICCDKGEVCSHGQLGDGTFPKCLRPHR